MTATILIVEDEPKLARLLADYLHQAGYTTHSIGNGSEVVAWVHDHAPELVLLDLMLPGSDGLTVCRELPTFSAVPVIMVTARVEEVDRLLGLELGVVDGQLCAWVNGEPLLPGKFYSALKQVTEWSTRRAEAEARQRAEAEKRAEAEARRREEAERQVARLKAELERLRRG